MNEAADKAADSGANLCGSTLTFSDFHVVPSQSDDDIIADSGAKPCVSSLSDSHVVSRHFEDAPIISASSHLSHSQPDTACSYIQYLCNPSRPHSFPNIDAHPKAPSDRVDGCSPDIDMEASSLRGHQH